jgi:hypothetical protein
MEVYKRGNSPYWYFDIVDPRAPGGRRRKSTKRTKKAEAQAVRPWQGPMMAPPSFRPRG